MHIVYYIYFKQVIVFVVYGLQCQSSIFKKNNYIQLIRMHSFLHLHIGRRQGAFILHGNSQVLN